MSEPAYYDPTGEDDAPSGTTPPSDPGAERAVLGAMLQSKDAIADAVEVLTGADFYHPAHEVVYDAIIDLYGRGEPVDPVTIGALLGQRGTLSRVGGGLFLHQLVSEVPITLNAAHWANIVRDKAVLRRLVDACRRGVAQGMSGTDDVAAIVDRVQADVFGVVGDRIRNDYAPIGDGYTDTIDQIEEMAAHGGGALLGLSTGIMDLDDLLGGFRPGQMIVVAGRPAMGKSVLGIDFARAASLRHNYASAVFSLEMTRAELTMRVLAAEAKVTLNKLMKGQLEDHDWGRIAGVTSRVMAAPLFIDDSPNLTMTEIRAKARRLKQAHDLRLIVIDYLQLMTSGKKVESRQVEVSEFSRQIKLLAKELEVPIVALSQLNRGPEQRTSKRPMMSDLRESGSIEQDADIVILLHREDMYDRDTPRPGEADLIVAKHRGGPTRDVSVAFQGHYARFVDMAQ